MKTDDSLIMVAYFLFSSRCDETRQAVLAIQMCELRKNRAGPLMNCDELIIIEIKRYLKIALYNKNKLFTEPATGWREGAGIENYHNKIALLKMLEWGFRD